MKIFFYLIRLTIYQFFQSIYYCTKRIKGQGSTNPVREEVSNMRLISIYYWSNTIPKFFFRENVEQHWKNIPRMSRWWIQKIFPFIDNYVQLYIHTFFFQLGKFDICFIFYRNIMPNMNTYFEFCLIHYWNVT